jgi:radical SAM superfamily enzyme YgiQ (UPF0313 family)
VISPLKSAFKGPIVIGGPAVGVSGAEMLSYFDLDHAVHGDGEEALLGFLDRLEQGRPLSGLPGLILRRSDGSIEENPIAPVNDLDGLPYVSIGRYIDLAPYHRFDSPLQVQTKRGCPLKCVYCTYNRIEGRKRRLKDPKRVASQIAKLVEETGVNHIEFTDSTFNLPLSHAKAVLREIIALNLDLRLCGMGLNPGAVDEELVQLMVQAGFTEVDLGVESVDDHVLKNMGKNYTSDQALAAARLLKAKKLPVSWMLLLGGPGETPESIRKTMAVAAREAAPGDLVVVGVGVRVYKGAPIARHLPDPDQDLLAPAAYEPDGLTIDEMRFLARLYRHDHPNILMYGEDLNYPAPFTRAANLLMKLFSPNTPIWRLFIWGRRAENFLGLGRLYKRRLILDNPAASARFGETAGSSFRAAKD